MNRDKNLFETAAELRQRAADFIERVLFRQTHSATVRLARFGVSAWVLLGTLTLLPASEHFWSYGSYIPLAETESMNWWNKALNLLSFSEVAPFYPLFITGQILSAVFAGLGILPRLSSALLYFFTMNLDNRAVVTMDGGNNLMHIILFLLIFIAPAEEPHPEAGGWREDLRLFKNAVSNMAFFMVRLQVALLYATAGLLKVQGELWPKGVALYYTMNVLEYGNQTIAGWMADFPLLLAGSCLATVFFQVSFPVLIWLRATRPFVMAVGTAFHLSIVFVMGLTTFGLAMCTSYLFFYTDERAQRWIDRFRLKKRLFFAAGAVINGDKVSWFRR